MKKEELSSLPLIKPDFIAEPSQFSVFEPEKLEKEVTRKPEVTRVPVFEPIKTSEFSSLPDIASDPSPFQFSSLPEVPRNNPEPETASPFQFSSSLPESPRNNPAPETSSPFQFSSLPESPRNNPAPETSSPFHFGSLPEVPKSSGSSSPFHFGFESHKVEEEPRRVPQKAQIPVFETNNEVLSKDHPFSETLFPTHDNRDKSELIETFTTPKPFVSSLGAIGTAKPSTNEESARLVVSALPKFNYHTSPGPHVTSLGPLPNGPAFGPTLYPYHPAPHHPDPHHAYGVPEPIYHDSQYGVPEPVHPAPGYGVPHAPIHHPTPGYGVPDPHPTPGYGHPEPVYHPVPGYGVPEPHPVPGYGVPEPVVHHPTPGYGVPEPIVHHPTPGYGVPEPVVHHPTPGYGVPEPIHHPDPGYGAPIHHPTPGYGVPEPVHHPEPGYGVPEPVHHPLHPIPGYGVPEPVHHPEPGYGAPEPGKATSDSMTSLLTHTVAHSTRPKTNNQVS